MIQDNSLIEQSRHSEQLSLQQLQLAELQKISSRLSSGIAGSTNIQSVGGQAINTTASNMNMPTNMTAMPNNQTAQNGSLLTNLAAVGGLAVKSGVNGINNGATVGRNALERSASYIENMQNSPFFAYKSIDWTRTNTEQAEYIQLQSQHKLQNASLRVASSLGNMGMAAAGGAVGSSFGPLGTIVGTVAGSAIGSIGGDEIMKHVGVQQGYESWLQQNSKRFINMFESNDSYGNGFNKKEENQLSKTLAKMNTDFFMSDDELFTMLNQVTDAGLMKSSSDVKDFEKKFKGLVESVKSGAKMLNTSYEEMVELYGEWNKMGIKTDAERAEFTSQIKTLSSITGASESETSTDLTALISNLLSGTTLDVTTASDVAQTDLAQSSIMREKGLWSEQIAKLVESQYGSDDTKVAAAMTSTMKNAFDDTNMKYATIAAMSLDENGNVAVDSDKLNSIINDIRSGKADIDKIVSQGGNILESGALGQSFTHKFQNMTADQIYGMMIEGGGDVSTSRFLDAMLTSYANKNGHLDKTSLMVDLGMATDTNQAQMFNEWLAGKDTLGDAIYSDVQNQNAANAIRNSASSEFGVSLTDRIKNGWESIWQSVSSGVSTGITTLIPSASGIGTSVKDFWTDTDTALRNGYSSAEKTDIRQNEYRNIFSEISESSQKLKEEFKIDLSKDLSKESDVSEASKGFDTFLDVLTSPSKWGTALSGIFGGESVEYDNTGLSHDGTSVKKLLKKINKSKTMTDKEKESMIENITQATGQTQDLVSSSLYVVTALGGRESREKMLDSITIDTATKVKTGAKSFADFTSEDVLNKLSLEDQKKIQELAVDQAVKQVNSKFGGNLDGLASLVKEKGYANNNEKVQQILEGGITKGEVKSLVKELMTASQGGSGQSEVSKILNTVSEETATATESMNKNMSEANSNMKDMSDKLEDFTDTVSKAIKTLFNTTSELERRVNKF